VFLSLSPTLAGRTVRLYDYAQEVGKTNKVPMLYVFGKEDDAGNKNALGCLKQIVGPQYSHEDKMRKDGFEYTGAFIVPGTKLVGSKLLSNALPTEDYIINKYLDSVLTKKGGVEWRQHRFEESLFFYSWAPALNQKVPAKLEGDKAPRLAPLSKLGIVVP